MEGHSCGVVELTPDTGSFLFKLDGYAFALLQEGRKSPRIPPRKTRDVSLRALVAVVVGVCASACLIAGRAGIIDPTALSLLYPLLSLPG